VTRRHQLAGKLAGYREVRAILSAMKNIALMELRALAGLLEHQRRAPDRAERIREAAAGDVRGGAVHGLEDRRRVGAGRDARARRHPHAALEHCRDVGQHVAEEIGRDDHVEAERVADQPRRQRVDERAVDGDAGVLGRDLLHHLVP